MSDFTVKLFHRQDAPYAIQLIVDEIPVWLDHNFPRHYKRDALTAVAGLAEEVGEVSRCAVKNRSGIRGTHDEWMAKLRNELGDVFVKLVDVADWYGIDLLEAIYERWATVRERDWITDTIQHGQGEEK